MNDSPRPDARTPEGKATQIPVQNSIFMRDVLMGPRIDTVHFALELFHVVTVDVGGTDPSACPAVNKYKAPAVAVLGPTDADGKKRVIKTFTGICSQQQVVDAMAEALKSKMDLAAYLEKEKRLVADIAKYDTFVLDLDTKRKLLTSDGSVSAGMKATFETDIKKREEDASKMETALKTQEDAIDALLAKHGLTRAA